MTIEDQLTVQRNWNLHPNNPNPDMTELKESIQVWRREQPGQDRTVSNGD